MQSEDTDITWEWDFSSVEQYPLHQRDLEIHKAAYKGNVALVASILDSTSAATDIDARNIHYCTPLHLAIRADHGSIVRLLLNAGADTTLKDDIDSAYFVSLSALDLAAWLGNQNALTALLDHGVTIPASSLRFSASGNYVACLALILEKLGDRNFCDISRLAGVQFAMERAALRWHVEALEMLLTYDKIFTDAASLEGTGKALGRALIYALYDYDCDDRCRPPVVCCPLDKRVSSIMESLVKAGADVNTRDDQDRYSSAFWACLHLPTVPRDVVRFLLDNGLRVDTMSLDESSPLCGIICDTNDDTSLLEDLITAGASVTDTDQEGYTPLHLVAHVSFAKLLIANGADVFAKTPQGETPLHTACERGNIPLVKLLLAHDASVHDLTSGFNHRAAFGWTPLLFAVDSLFWSSDSTLDERLQLVQLLHIHGADVHITAPDGLTALHRAVQCGNEKLVRYLIDSGVDARAKTLFGTTTLHCASKFTKPEDEVRATSIINMLLEHGAELNAIDQKGQTVLLISVARPETDELFSPTVCNPLLEKGAETTTSNAEGETAKDIVNESYWWTFGEDRLVRKKSPSARVASSGRGRGWGRGRGASGRVV
jgi:ankyrin repeat protein